MYTELMIDIKLRKDIPDDMWMLFKYWFSPWEEDVEYPLPDPLPDHPLFLCRRWKQIGSVCQSIRYDHEIQFTDEIDYYRLHGATDFKDYDSEQHKFLEYITPYIIAEKDEIIGYSHYEEFYNPCDIIFDGEKIEYGEQDLDGLF